MLKCKWLLTLQRNTMQDNEGRSPKEPTETPCYHYKFPIDYLYNT
jgi:hypothetical protein